VRLSWVELAETATLRGNASEFAQAAAALEALATDLSTQERSQDTPLLRLQLLKATWAMQTRSTSTSVWELLTPLLILDVDQRSSLMPIKAEALAVAARYANGAGDRAAAERWVNELKKITHHEFDATHPIFRVVSELHL
jgi:hypothetical protein